MYLSAEKCYLVLSDKGLLPVDRTVKLSKCRQLVLEHMVGQF